MPIDKDVKVEIVRCGDNNVANTSEKVINLDGVTGVGYKVNISSGGWTGLIGALNEAIDDSETAIGTMSGISCWLKANSLDSLPDGTPISHWADSSGNSRHATTGGIGPAMTLSVGSYAVVVGVGGISGQASAVKGSNGGNSSFNGLIAYGGGGGGAYPANGLGLSGGSGGGGGASGYAGGSGTAGQGYAGGSSASTAWGSGGGGGAGGAGSAGIANTVVSGGAGVSCSITGTAVTYCGGGYGNSDGGTVNATTAAPGWGANGTGSPVNSPYSGSDGVVIIRYRTDSGLKALGGAISVWKAYTIHVFSKSGTLVVSSGSAPIEYLIAGGGGGTGYDVGGGGGAGGLIFRCDGPVLKKNKLNGQSVLNFNTDQWLKCSYNFPAPCSVFVVSRYISGGTRGRVLTAVNNNWILGHHSDRKNAFYFDGWVSNPEPCYGGNNPYWGMYSALIGGSGVNSYVYVNGNYWAANTGGVTGPNYLCINKYSTEVSDCEVAEILIFSRVVTNAERTRIENYLRKKYRIDAIYKDLYESPGALKAANPQLGNGLYFIKPKQLPDAIQVYCDLTSDGGTGWMLVENTGPKNTSTMDTSFVGSVPVNIYPNQTAYSKLSDTLINLLRKQPANSIVKLTRPNNPTFASYPMYFREDKIFQSDSWRSVDVNGTSYSNKQSEDTMYYFYTSYSNAYNGVSRCGGAASTYGSPLCTWSNLTNTDGGAQWYYIHNYSSEGSISNNTYEGSRSERQALIWIQSW